MSLFIYSSKFWPLVDTIDKKLFFKISFNFIQIDIFKLKPNLLAI